MKHNPMYAEYASAYADAIEANIYNAQFERPSLLALLPDVKNKSVLDLGCGPGVYAQILTQRGARVTAVDGSAEMVAITSDRLGPSVNCYQQNLNDGLPTEKDHSYDVVISPLTIHYLQDWRPFLKAVHRVLKHAGSFVFSTHHPMVDFTASPSGDYFRTELIEEQWDTIGKPVDVAYYRRPLTGIFESLKAAGLMVADFSEGEPVAEMKQSNPEKYLELKTKPCFLFFRCITVA